MTSVRGVCSVGGWIRGAERGARRAPLVARSCSVGRYGRFADGGLCDLELVTDALARKLVLD